MSSGALPAGTPSIGLPAPTPTDPTQSAEAPRTWLGRAMLDTVGRAGARVGLAWIIVVAFCAVFAPVLANSFPILAKIDGKWSSPMLRQFSAVDWTLPIVAAVGIVLAFMRRTLVRLRIVIFMAAVVVVLSIFLTLQWRHVIGGSGAPIYDAYRTAAREGRVQWALDAPIPFSPSDRLRDQFDPANPHPRAPSRQHLMGTEAYGADILSNIIHACRIAMSIGFISTGLSLVIAIVVGGLMGYFVGAVDLIGMRLVEIFSSIPRLYLLLAFVAYYDRNIYIIMAILGLTGWVGDARFVRAEFLKLRNQDFVHAAIASGLPLRSVLWRHLLPNALAPLLVSTSFGVADAILTESSLSFLGLGLVDEASWGRLLDQARGAGGGFHWWLATFPGVAIFLTVLAYNLIGEALRDALDPKLRGIE